MKTGSNMTKWSKFGVILLLTLALPVAIAGCGESAPDKGKPVPEADFSAEPTSGFAPFQVQFTDQSTGDITGWEWDFDNDGTVDSTEQNPLHTYKTGYAYSVSLTVKGFGGSDSETKTDLITLTGLYGDLESYIKLSFSEKFTDAKDGAHLFLNLATEKIYPTYNCELNSTVEIEGNAITVEIENVLIPAVGPTLLGPATFSADISLPDGEYQLTIKHKDTEDSYILEITRSRIQVNPVIQTFTLFGQPNTLYRVPENVIWIYSGHYNRIGCEDNQQYIESRERFFNEPEISDLQVFTPEEGEYLLSYFKGEGFKYFFFFDDVLTLRGLVESYATFTSKDIQDKERCFLVYIYTWRGDSFSSTSISK